MILGVRRRWRTRLVKRLTPLVATDLEIFLGETGKRPFLGADLTMRGAESGGGVKGAKRDRSHAQRCASSASMARTNPLTRPSTRLQWQSGGTYLLDRRGWRLEGLLTLKDVGLIGSVRRDTRLAVVTSDAGPRSDGPLM